MEGKTANWNPWHGCRKVSAGCLHCYMHRMDDNRGIDGTIVRRTADFSLPARQNRQGGFKLEPGTMVYTCFTSDFLVEEADPWRQEAWAMMRQRADLTFFFITKRIERLERCAPPDWGAGYPNVFFGCTMENQQMADRRMPVFLAAPIARRTVICEPLLGSIELGRWLEGGRIFQLVVGGESGPEARVCDYRWILSLREQCLAAGVSFSFKQTGARFLKDGRLYRVPRGLQHAQAKKAGIDYLRRWDGSVTQENDGQGL